MKPKNSPPRRRTCAVLLLLLALGFAPARAAQVPPNCATDWIPTFGGAPLPGAAGSTILALAVFDDGHGPALYAGGSFGTTSTSDYLARWDGWGWTRVGTGMSGGGVRALAVFDAGGGPELYVGGSFTSVEGVPANHLARWNGTSWSAVGSGLNGAYVSALQVYDDGSGPALFVGGSFTQAGGFLANDVARWNGSGWSALSSGANGPVTSFCTFDDGSGTALYAGGAFTSAGGVTCNHLGKWDGSAWFALGTGITGGSGLPPNSVDALCVFDDGSGPALFAGGTFGHAGGIVANRIAKWDGGNWSAVGGGTSGPVSALRVFDDGSGPALYAGGSFLTAGGALAYSFARWSGSAWTWVGGGVGSGSGRIQALAEFDDGGGAALFAGGHFEVGGSPGSTNIARWSAAGLSSPGFGLDGIAECAVVFDDGSGPALFVGGDFQHAGGRDAQSLAKWDGSRWTPVQTLVPIYEVRALAVFDDGTGPALYVGGTFLPLPSVLLRWDGTNWTVLPNGPLHDVSSLCVYDDGSGPALYAASDRPSATGVWIGKWNGSSLAPLPSLPNAMVSALAVFDDGSGPGLYAGGDFTSVGGMTAGRIAKWNGTNWSALGSGVGGANVHVRALAVFDDGTGAALHVGGQFTSAGGFAANDIAKWNGNSWSALGSGISGGAGASVLALTGFDDGTGARLFVGGSFASAGGGASNGLATWDGTSWRDASSGLENLIPGYAPSVRSLVVADDGSATGEALLVGGALAQRRSGDSGLAKWDLPLACMPIGTPFCSPSTGALIPCPCANPATGARKGCDNSEGTGGATLVASGLASLANDQAVLTSAGERASALSVFLQGASTISAGVVFGQGVRCIAGGFLRLYSRNAVGGSARAPVPGEDSISARSAALGDTIGAGQHRYYGVYYRDPIVLGSCPATSTFNITQQVDLLWAP